MWELCYITEGLFRLILNQRNLKEIPKSFFFDKWIVISTEQNFVIIIGTQAKMDFIYWQMRTK